MIRKRIFRERFQQDIDWNLRTSLTFVKKIYNKERKIRMEKDNSKENWKCITKRGKLK